MTRSTDETSTEPEDFAPGDATEPEVTDVAQAAHNVERRLDSIERDLRAGGTAGQRAARANRRQLLELVVAARDQAHRIGQTGPAAATPGLGLWRIAQPGTLRTAADRTVRRSSGVAVLVPVMITWFVLGIAEISYASRFSGAPAAGRPSFFADWIAAPLWRGPAVLSLLIIASVAMIMLGYRSVEREQRAVDALDRAAQDWESDLHRPVETLRQLVEQDRSDRGASDELHRAASRIDQAARSLSGAQDVVHQLGTTLHTLAASVGELAGTAPEIGRHAAALAEADMRLRAAAVEIGNRSEPILTVVRDTEAAATAAATAATTADRTIIAAREESERAERLVSRSDQFRQALDDAREPFVRATAGLGSTTGSMAETSERLAATVTELQATIRRVNWLALVADGLRNADGDHGRPGQRR